MVPISNSFWVKIVKKIIHWMILWSPWALNVNCSSRLERIVRLNSFLRQFRYSCEINCEIKYLLEVISIFLITSSAEWFIQSSKFMRICFTLVGFLQRGINFTLLLTYFYVNKTLLRMQSFENNRAMSLVESMKIRRENVSTWSKVAGLLVTATTVTTDAYNFASGFKQYKKMNFTIENLFSYSATGFKQYEY